MDREKVLDESILTAVPRSMAAERNLVERLHFDDAECRKCLRYDVCKRAAASLPFVVRSIHMKGSEFKCARGEPVAMCVVVPRRSHRQEEEHAVPRAHAHLRPLFALDANIFLNAYNCHPEMGDACRWVLESSRVRICTTRQVLSEAYDTKGNRLPAQLELVEVGAIEGRIMDLRPAVSVKEPSEADRSLMQAVLNNPEIRGIVTFDPDFVNIAAAGLLTTWTGHKVEVLNAFELRSRFQ